MKTCEDVDLTYEEENGKRDFSRLHVAGWFSLERKSQGVKASVKGFLLESFRERDPHVKG